MPEFATPHRTQPNGLPKDRNKKRIVHMIDEDIIIAVSGEFTKD